MPKAVARSVSLATEPHHTNIVLGVRRTKQSPELRFSLVSSTCTALVSFWLVPRTWKRDVPAGSTHTRHGCIASERRREARLRAREREARASGHAGGAACVRETATRVPSVS